MANTRNPSRKTAKRKERPVFKHLRKCAAAVAAVAAVALAGAAPAHGQIAVGGKAVTGQRVLAEMTAQYLAAKGYGVEKRVGLSSVVLRHALLAGQVDLYWETVGTSLRVYNEVENGAQMSPEKAHAKVKALDAEKGLVWLRSTDVDTTYALAMREPHAEKLGIETLSGLVDDIQNQEPLTLAVDSEWAGRPDGLAAFQENYDVRWPRGALRRMQTDRIYRALADGEVAVGRVVATDGRIAAFDLRLLADDKNVFPNDALTPVVRADVLRAHPDLRQHLNTLGASLDAETMQRLTRLVAVAKKPIAEVAESYLKAQGWL